MKSIKSRGVRLTTVVAAAMFALTACGGGSVEAETEENESKAPAADCGDVNIAIHPWVGFEANAYVVGELAKANGCTVNYIEIKEGGPSYEALAAGDIDMILEEWSHAEELAAGVEAGEIVDLGSTGNVGIIGWYVPGWLAEAHPEVLDWENLNDFAADFATSESGGKGQFLGADPTYTQFDEAIVENLGLDFQVVFSGGEAATIEAFKKAQENEEWLIGYFWEPQFIHAQVPMVRVALPPYEEGCDSDPAAVACDYAETVLKKVGRTAFLEEGSVAANILTNFQWTNDDQNLVAKYITADGMTPEEAAAKWIADNQEIADSWLS